MPTIQRPRYDGYVNTSVAALETSVVDLEIIPSGQVWEINKVVCAEENTGDGKSGEFIIEFGSGASWSQIAHMILTGNTHDSDVDRSFLGDGAKRFRVTRINHSIQSKTMVARIEGVKRL